MSLHQITMRVVAKNNTKPHIMKKLFVLIALIAVFAACNTQPKVPVIIVDTLAIKQKAILEEQARVKTEKDSIAAIAAARRANNRNNERGEARNPGTNEAQVSSASGGTAEAPAKKGWSAAAKGTVIGAGAGAIAGGIIGHNLGGAAIGAAAGGGAGYLIGRAKDRKTGRVVKKTAPVQ